MKRIRDTPIIPEPYVDQQDPWALHMRPEDSNIERPDLPKQLELPFATEDRGGSNGCTN